MPRWALGGHICSANVIFLDIADGATRLFHGDVGPRDWLSITYTSGTITCKFRANGGHMTRAQRIMEPICGDRRKCAETESRQPSGSVPLGSEIPPYPYNEICLQRFFISFNLGSSSKFLLITAKVLIQLLPSISSAAWSPCTAL